MLFTSILRIFMTRSIKPFIFGNTYQENLDFENIDDLGLYVHIPFCRSLCSFCPYCKEKYNKEAAYGYKVALLKEIDLVCKNMSGKKEVTSLYFGGGTPALMIDDLEDVIEALKKNFVIKKGIGLELHPDDITDENLDKLSSAGVTMLSIGVQSFNKDCLYKLGRTADSIFERLEMIKKKNFDVVDLDLIFAIPGQTCKNLEDDIKKAFSNGATQVSTYPFIDFTFADNKYKPISEKEKKRMLKYLVQYCSEMNIKRTSVWTFAKHNTEKYSSITRDNFLGFGVSATTLLKDTFKINTFSIEAYRKRIEEGFLPTALTINLSKRQRAVYYLFWNAYAMKINIKKFEKLIGKPLVKMFGFEFYIAQKLGLIKKNGDFYELTEKAAYIYHDIEQVYTSAYIDKMWSVLRKQAFPDKIVLK